MVVEDAYNKILEYLKKEDSANTFRMAKKLGIERHKLLNIIKKLEEKEAVEFRHGVVKFLKFPKEEKLVTEEKKPIEIKEILSKKPKKLIIFKKLQAENKKLKERLLELEKTIKELEQRPPKIIRKTIVKKVPVEKTVIKKVIKRIPAKPEKRLFKKINFAKLGKNIRQLNIPKILKNL